MKITRKHLLIITASLGALLIVYSLVRHFTGLGLDPKLERYFLDGIVIVALGLFMYNRKLARDEKQARDAEAQREERALEEGEADQNETGQDETLPHWERRKDPPNQDSPDQDPADPNPVEEQTG
ncbi:MAG: hypothetical protein LBO65_07855 [Spirochaetaceae bacterium]|jgi:hypothetical protein|nr:hypothetical protein [Spirochaetaceae bacterium]